MQEIQLRCWVSFLNLFVCFGVVNVNLFEGIMKAHAWLRQTMQGYLLKPNIWWYIQCALHNKTQSMQPLTLTFIFSLLKMLFLDLISDLNLIPFSLSLGFYAFIIGFSSFHKSSIYVSWLPFLSIKNKWIKRII